MNSINIYQQIKTIIVYSFFVIVIIGIIFNSLTFIIFSRKRFKQTVFYTYFRCLIISDTICLIMPINKVLEYNYNIYIEKMSTFLCKSRVYLPYSISPISGWILVIISLDRWIIITNLYKFELRKKFWFQILICFLIFVFNFAVYSPGLMFRLEKNTDLSNLTNQTNNDFICSSSNYSKLIQWMDAFEGCIIPFSLMILFTCLTIMFIYLSRKKTASSSSIRMPNSNINNNNKQSTMKKRDVRFAIVSVILNVIFLMLNSPYTFLNLFDDFISNQSISELSESIRLFFYYLNFSITFFINFYVNSTFRDEFLILIGKKSLSYNNPSYRKSVVG